MSRRDAAVKERFVVCLNLLAPDDQLAALDGDAQLVAAEAGDCERDLSLSSLDCSMLYGG